MADIVTIETPGLGDRSYLVHDGEIAVVVDPQRDMDRVLAVAGSLGVSITHVAETHLHNDYVTGGLALARKVGAEYLVPAGDQVHFERRPVADGDVVRTGSLILTALHTPGHTPNHTSYLLAGAEGPFAVFTGGSMLFGAVGRTDLIGADLTERLTRDQYRSVRRLAAELPDHVGVHPTHGFGSFCSATQTAGDSSTIGSEKRQNIALVVQDEDAFVERLLAGLGSYPRYYAHMSALNAAGPSEPDLSPPAEVDRATLLARLDAGDWVVDLRERRAFAKAHLAGTVSIELADAFPTFFGWTLPWEAQVTLVGDSIDQVSEARRHLARIGVDRLAGAVVEQVEALAEERCASYEVAGFADLGRIWGRDGMVVVDVRAPEEWREAHLEGAVHIPFWELADRVREVPPGEVWVHCAGGYRASIAASLLDRAGRRVVLIDDTWGRAGSAGLPVVEGR